MLSGLPTPEWLPRWAHTGQTHLDIKYFIITHCFFLCIFLKDRSDIFQFNAGKRQNYIIVYVCRGTQGG